MQRAAGRDDWRRFGSTGSKIMTHRYVAISRLLPKPRSDYEYMEDRPGPSTISVIVDEETPIDTGLMDASGTPLYRIKNRGPWGFSAKSTDD